MIPDEILQKHPDFSQEQLLTLAKDGTGGQFDWFKGFCEANYPHFYHTQLVTLSQVRYPICDSCEKPEATYHFPTRQRQHLCGECAWANVPKSTRERLFPPGHYVLAGPVDINEVRVTVIEHPQPTPKENWMVPYDPSVEYTHEYFDKLLHNYDDYDASSPSDFAPDIKAMTRWLLTEKNCLLDNPEQRDYFMKFYFNQDTSESFTYESEIGEGESGESESD